MADSSHRFVRRMNRVRLPLLVFIVLTISATYWFLMFLGTHWPMPPSMGFNVSDKLQHALGYAGLGFWLLASGRLWWQRGVRVALLVLAVGAAYGVLDELTQMLVPNRSADVLDWAADIVGLLLGIAAFTVLDLLLLRKAAFADRSAAQAAWGRST